MGTLRYVGEAAVIAQVDTFTPTNVEIGDIFTLTSVGWDGVTEVLAYTAIDTSASTVSAALIALWNDSTITACTGVTASGSSTIVLTADTAGVAFSVTSTAVNGGATDDQTLDRVATTKNEGPSDWTSVDNWDTGAIPVNDDDVYIEGAFTILYGLSQSAVELDSLNVSGARIGTNPVTVNSANWRAVFLAIESPIVEIGYLYGLSLVTQAVPVNLDLGIVASAITVHNAGSNGTGPAVRITSKHADTTLKIRKGYVGFYNNSSGDAELDYIDMEYVSNKAGDVDLYVESGCTIDTINQKAGDLVLWSALTAALTIEAGTLKTEGSGAIPTLTVKAGTCTLNSTGTITTMVIDGGIVDFTKSSVARTVTNLKLNPGSTLKHDPADTTFSNWTEPDDPVILSASAA